MFRHFKIKFMVIIISSIAVGCVEPLPENYHGKWKITGELADGSNNVMAWYKVYKFERNHYYLDGYPPLKEYGMFKILKIDGTRIQVKMYPHQEKPKRNPYIIWLELKESGKKLQIDSQLYHRIN